MKSISFVSTFLQICPENKLKLMTIASKRILKAFNYYKIICFN